METNLAAVDAQSKFDPHQNNIDDYQTFQQKINHDISKRSSNMNDSNQFGPVSQTPMNMNDQDRQHFVLDREDPNGPNEGSNRKYNHSYKSQSDLINEQ
jgi:hypothetical protein